MHGFVDAPSVPISFTAACFWDGILHDTAYRSKAEQDVRRLTFRFQCLMHQAVMRKARAAEAFLLLGAWCGALGITAPTQAAAADAPESELEEVLLTATPTPLPARQAPGSTTPLTREQ